MRTFYERSTIPWLTWITEIIKCRKLMCKKKRLSIEQCRCTLVKKCLFPTMKGEGLVLPAKGRECSEKEPV